MDDIPTKKIGELLLEQRLITPTMLQEALNSQEKEYHPLGKILIDLGYITTDDLNNVLAKQFGSLYINPKTFAIRNKDLLNLIPENLARKYTCFPFELKENDLTLVIEDPLDTEALSEISKLTGLHIRPVHGKRDAILEILNKSYEPVARPSEKDFSTFKTHDEIVPPSSPVKREFPVDGSPGTESAIERPWVTVVPPQPVPRVSAIMEIEKPEDKLPISYLTFENFVVGPSNQLAWAAAQNVVAQPGIGFNPLFIYGGVGLGKTHLSNAIGNALIEKYPKAKICFISIDVFIRELINAVEHGTLKDFKSHYRNLDILLIDDIQFLSGHEQTQEEFFYLFEQLHRSNGQMVITSDRLPRQIDKLEDRLRSRFEGGLTVDVQIPDLETRMAIFRKKTSARGLDIPDEIARIVAIRLPSNVREMEGIANRILAQSQLMREPVTLEMVEKILDTVAPLNSTDKQPITPVITRPGVLPSQGFR